MYYTTPPPSPYNASPPVTPHSAVPLLLQPANRSSKSPSRSSTFHYPSSSQPPSPFDPMPPSLQHRPPPPARASTAPSSFLVHQDLSFPTPPPLPLAAPPFRHHRVGSSVPRYALEDVVVRNELPTLGYDHNREPSDESSMTYYEGDTTPKEGKLVVNKEGFLENEVPPVRGFWSRWFRGMVILLVFLAIITGVAIGVSEYYDSKHRSSKSSEQEGGGGGSSSSISTISTTVFASQSGMGSSSLASLVESSSSSPSRMRTTVRTTSTSTSTSSDRSSPTETSSAHGQSSTSSSPDSLTSSQSTTQHAGTTSTETSTSEDPIETSTDDSEDDPSTTTEGPSDSSETTGRLFGLASATASR
ncbi:hypothetical protein JCM3765_005494 [Sporobolomyces pararoseus]